MVALLLNFDFDPLLVGTEGVFGILRLVRCNGIMGDIINQNENCIRKIKRVKIHKHSRKISGFTMIIKLNIWNRQRPCSCEDILAVRLFLSLNKKRKYLVDFKTRLFSSKGILTFLPLILA